MATHFTNRNFLSASFMIGLIGGLCGVLYLFFLREVESLFMLSASAGIRQSMLLIITGTTIALLYRWLGSPGNVELLVDNIHLNGGNLNFRDLRSLIPASLLCIGAGGAAGPEAPLVQATGTIGTFLADRFGFNVEERRVLTISGMAAGFTVLFGAPIGAAIFALEILHHQGLEYYEALIPAVCGSIAGYLVSSLTVGLGLKPVWFFDSPGALNSYDLLYAAGAGILSAMLAYGFTHLNMIARKIFDKFPILIRPIIGSGILSLLAILNVYALGFGESQFAEILKSQTPVVLLSAGFAKLIGTTITLASDWCGGFIIPLFFIGATTGKALSLFLPHANAAVIMAALMAGTNTGVTKTPLGSTLVVSAMTGIRLVPTTLIAAILSFLLSNKTRHFHTQRPRIKPEYI